MWLSLWIKKKIPQGLRGKKYTNHFSLQSKGAVTVEDYWTECQYYDIVWVCFMFGNCNHCCFCCGHPFTMLGVSLFISCKNKIQCVCVCVCVWKKKKKVWCSFEYNYYFLPNQKIENCWENWYISASLQYRLIIQKTVTYLWQGPLKYVLWAITFIENYLWLSAYLLTYTMWSCKSKESRSSAVGAQLAKLLLGDN